MKSGAVLVRKSTLSTRWRTDMQEPVQHDVAAQQPASMMSDPVRLHVRALSRSWEVTPWQSHDASVSNKPLFKAIPEAENRATGVPFLLRLSQPAQPVFLLLITEDCFFHPWGSVVLLDFHFSLRFIHCSSCPSNSPKNVVPPHQHCSTTHVPV